MAQLFAWIFTGLCVLVIAFQLALAAGAPWGEWAMGGKYPGRFPIPLRIAAVVQAGVLALLACVILSRAGVSGFAQMQFPEFAFWIACAFSAVAAVMNSITPSKKERALWAPVTVAMLVSVIGVAFL